MQAGQATTDALWQEAQARMTARIRATMAMPLDGFPHYADPDTGKWVTSPDGFWTGGFWVGELWLAGGSGPEGREFREAAEAWLRRLSVRVNSNSVFRAFLFFYGAVLGAELAGNAYAREIGIAAARSLAGGFNPVAGVIPLGTDAEESHTVGNSDSNIDGLIASPILLWGARETGDGALTKIALSHARRNAEFCVQADGSVIQSASFDPATGAVTRRFTHKGIARNSIWTRAQAWAMLGYALSASLARDEGWLLDQADRVAQWWMSHVPADRVAYWDFNAPKTPETKRDTSGTAIAAASLLRLAAIHPDREHGARYRRFAEETVRALVERHLRPSGILADGCFDPNNGTAVGNELIWGDYFLYEALGVLTGGPDSALFPSAKA
jgi:unsaturated chondroitin disaccharide hydrolase